jgi:hypothetical protein
VEWAVKGRITRRLDAFGAKFDCGAGIAKGKRIGVVLSRGADGWFADSGDLLDADELLAAAPKGTAVKLGSLGLSERLWVRLQTFPGKAPAALVLAFAVTFLITLRADRRRIRDLKTSGQPAP